MILHFALQQQDLFHLVPPYTDAADAVHPTNDDVYFLEALGNYGMQRDLAKLA